MIGISKLYCGAVEPSDVLRYKRRSKELPSGLLQFSKDKKPVVVWNCTKTCNLRCQHCYAGSDAQRYDQLNTDEAKAMIDDLAAFGSPVLLFSGGEPCVREDLLELMQYAKQAGMRVVISTNGTLITPDLARQFAEVGLSYVGISIDGKRETHDAFRGVPGAFDRSLEGVANAKAAGLKVGAYWYSYATSAYDAKLEAQTCMWAIQGKKFEYPIFFDIEEKWQINQGVNFCSPLVSAFCSELESNGYYAGFYTSTSFAKSSISYDVQCRYAYWAAEWGSRVNYSNQYGMWQYKVGYCAGANGDCDLDYAFIDYPSVMKEFHLNGY